MNILLITDIIGTIFHDRLWLVDTTAVDHKYVHYIMSFLNKNIINFHVTNVIWHSHTGVNLVLHGVVVVSG